MTDLHTVEVLESHRNPNHYGRDPEFHWTLRRIKVVGGWIYESRALQLDRGANDYRYDVRVVGISSVFVPDHEVSHGE